jgi:NAD(P)-dependent dehydrogenase (short-subunit alcohol dehydrogenase family)
VSRELDGQVLIVVGGTSGIGASAAKACVEAGAQVVVVGRDETKAHALTDRLGESCRHLVADARDVSTAGRAIELAQKEFGQFDGLYHVAGGSGRKSGDGPLHQLTSTAIDFTLDLNLKSLMYSNQAAAAALMQNGRGGSVLNMGSVLGFSPARQHFATHVYAAAKSAVIGLTRSAAAYYAPHNIRFNLIAPGLVETPMAQRAVDDNRVQQFIKTKQPLDGGRIIQPADLDAAAVFFLSRNSAMITGQVLAIDGGWSVSEGQLSE